MGARPGSQRSPPDRPHRPALPAAPAAALLRSHQECHPLLHTLPVQSTTPWPPSGCLMGMATAGSSSSHGSGYPPEPRQEPRLEHGCRLWGWQRQPEPAEAVQRRIIWGHEKRPEGARNDLSAASVRKGGVPHKPGSISLVAWCTTPITLQGTVLLAHITTSPASLEQRSSLQVSKCWGASHLWSNTGSKGCAISGYRATV